MQAIVAQKTPCTTQLPGVSNLALLFFYLGPRATCPSKAHRQPLPRSWASIIERAAASVKTLQIYGLCFQGLGFGGPRIKQIMSSGIEPRIMWLLLREGITYLVGVQVQILRFYRQRRVMDISASGSVIQATENDSKQRNSKDLQQTIETQKKMPTTPLTISPGSCHMYFSWNCWGDTRNSTRGAGRG